MTRIQLETGFIDLPIGTDFPIDLSFAEITKSGARTGGASRSLEVDGTENNTTILGALFDIDLSNDTFDRNKKTIASVIQNGVEVFDGFIQLLEIIRVNRVRGTNHKLVKYKINVFDEVSNFFNEMGDKELTALSFPELSHVFNRANIIASWSNTSGYTYPQYAKSDNIYTLRDFKPAIYEWEYFKKIFATNGYTFTFDEYNEDTIQMDKRIIPFNGKQGDDTIGAFLKQNYSVRGEMASANYVIDNTSNPTYPIGWLPMLDYLSAASVNNYATAANSKIDLSTIFEDAQSQWSTVNNDLTNLGGQGRNFQILTNYDYNIQVRALGGVAWEADGGLFSTLRRCDVKICLVAQSTTNVNKIAFIDAGQTAISFGSGTTSYAAGWQPLASGNNASFANLGIFDANEKFDVHALIFGRYFSSTGVQVVNNPNYTFMSSLSADSLSAAIPVPFLDSSSGTPIRLEFDIDITNLQFRAIPDITELTNGTNVDVNAFIPKKIKQRDLISAISKSYNLLFTPDPDNETNIIIKTRDKYYNDGLEWDWTEKFDEKQPNSITFLNNDVKQRQEYKYKDDKDSLNAAYQAEFVETYGQSTLILDNEYTVGTDKREIMYSPTPSVGSGINIPLPSINGVNPDCNIRVLLHNGVGTVSQYPFYDDLLPNASAVAQVTDYNQTSMFDNDLIPNFSICYDSPNILFHSFQQGQTTNYLYNLHHQQELTTINEGKRLTGYFNLTEADFQKLSKTLDWKIFIKDNGWFFVSKIYGYNSGKRTITKVDLITADEKLRLKYKRPFRPFGGTTVSFGGVVNKHFDTVGSDTNIRLGNDILINGKYNLAIGERIKIQGDVNTVRASDVQIMGSINNVPVGLNGTKVIGDQTTPSRSGVYVGGVISEGISLKAVSGNYTVKLDDEIVIEDTAATTITLLDSTLFKTKGGKRYTVKNTSVGNISVTSPNLIDGIVTQTLTPNQSITVISDSTDWIII
jgi:hypothetical protein